MPLRLGKAMQGKGRNFRSGEDPRHIMGLDSFQVHNPDRRGLLT